jgi:hypothetical protein
MLVAMCRQLILVVTVLSGAIAFWSPVGMALSVHEGSYPSTEEPSEEPSEPTEECRWLGTCYR